MIGLLSISCLMMEGRVWSFLSMLKVIICFMSASVSVVSGLVLASLVRDWSLLSLRARSAVLRLRTSILVVDSSVTLFILFSRVAMVMGKGAIDD